MKIFFFLVLLLLSKNSYSWDLNDVTYILPLPTKSDFKAYVYLVSSGHLNVESLDIDKNSADALSEDLLKQYVAIAFRIDPCFKHVPAESCQPQLRVVWQAFRQKGDSFSAENHSIHTFYNLNHSDFKTLINTLKTLTIRFKTEKLPLQVHPAFKNGMNTMDAQNLLMVFKERMRQKNLFRAAISSTRENGNFRNWGLQRFDFKKGENSTPPRPRISAKRKVSETHSQGFWTDDDGGFDFALSNGNDYDESPLVGHFFNRPYNPQEDADFNYLTSIQVQNPKLQFPGTVDCFTCHISQSTQFRTKSLASDSMKIEANELTYFIQGFNLTNLGNQQQDKLHIRMIGYHGNELIINNRVIFESAEVANQLNRKP